ncbi:MULTISPECIES: AfsR/SARP family transcriptional regulator [unclassified Streptomyces]|uniref:AfsR/SARP family transcriptional regulator n=1 Tax=unclassified Streptomyces TaxID=2593676 RepID=UPI0011B94981|nr:MULTISPECIES: BTAD domain-containing putative transcriptional regulator [unclassified Streptomyces]
MTFESGGGAGQRTSGAGNAPASGLRIGILGPLQVLADGAPLAAPQGRQRNLLAALLLSPDRVLSHDDLVDLVWDGTPPQDARGALRTCVMRLRRSLGSRWAGRLITHDSGYQVRADVGEVDWLAHREHRQEAARAVRKQDWATVLEQLDAALALWRGPALVDVPSQRLREAHLGHLEESHAQALEWRYEALLGLHRHSEVTLDIQQSIGRYPLRENFRAQLMLALCRSDREAEALAAYQQARRVLVDELGTEPSGRLREIHQKILTGTLAPAPAAVPAARGGAPVPAQSRGEGAVAPGRASGDGKQPAAVRRLPLPSRNFVGRSAELTALDALGQGPVAGGRPGGGLVVITGPGGIGKTSLALSWAHRQAGTSPERFPDGRLLVNLHGFDPVVPALGPLEALGRLLTMLGVVGEAMPNDLDSRIRMYRDLMAQRSVLVILDNAVDAEQVRPLLPNSPDALVLVTSRHQLPGLVVTEGAGVLTLGLLDAGDSLALLERMLGPARIREEPEAANRLADICGRMPLTTCIAGARALLEPALSLTDLCRELQEEPDPLERFETGDQDSSLRRILDGSYARLAPAAASVYRLLGVHHGSHITLGAVAHMTGVSLPEARKVLSELVRCSLLTIGSANLYTMHDIVRAHAAERAHATDPAAARTAARHRLFDHYLSSAEAAASLIDPFRAFHPAPSGPEPLPGEFGAPGQAATWFDTHGPVLLTMIDNCAQDGTAERAWLLLERMSPYLSRNGNWREQARGAQCVLAATRHLPEHTGAAFAELECGCALDRLGEDEEALSHLGRALRLYRARGDSLGEARARLGLTRFFGRRRDAPACREHAAHALAGFERNQDTNGRAEVLNALGWYGIGFGEPEASIAPCEEALSLYRSVGNAFGEADTWDTLAHAGELLGDFAEALRCYRNAIALDDRLDRVGHRVNRADTLLRYGDLSKATGHAEQALEAWRSAAAVLAPVEHPLVARVRSRLAAGAATRPVSPVPSAAPRSR